MGAWRYDWAFCVRAALCSPFGCAWTVFPFIAFSVFCFCPARSLWLGRWGSRGHSPLPAVSDTTRQRVYTIRMLAFPDDAGRISRHEENETSAAGKQKCCYRKTSCAVGENARCSPGKQQVSLWKAGTMRRENERVGSRKRKMGKAKKCGLRFLPLFYLRP